MNVIFFRLIRYQQQQKRTENCINILVEKKPENVFATMSCSRILWTSLLGFIKKQDKTQQGYPRHPHVCKPAEVMCHFGYAYIIEHRRPCPDTISWWKYSALRTKFKVIQMSRIYGTNRLLFFFVWGLSSRSGVFQSYGDVNGCEFWNMLGTHGHWAVRVL